MWSLLRRLLLVSVLACLAAPVAAQTITVTALPAQTGLSWDAVPTATSGFKVYDGTLVIATLPAGSVTTTITLSTVGPHAITVTSLAGALESAKSTPIVTATVVLQAPTAPPSPGNVRLTALATCASPIGTTAVRVVDASCSVWTLVGAQVTKDGTALAGWQGSTYLYLASGVYVQGNDLAWYRWTGTTFVSAGAVKPTL